MPQSLENLNLKKSNTFITAKFKASPLENQLMAIALTRLEEQYDDKGLLCFEAEIYPGEIRQLIKDDDHIYRDLKKVSKMMVGRTICLEDGKGNFNVFSLVPNAKYEDHVFKITFNKELKPHIFELTEKFTTLQLSMVTELKDWSYRIYEVLKKDLYLADRMPDKHVKIEYRLAEFRFMIGLANINSDVIKEDIKQNPNWDELYDKLPNKEKKYERPGDLEKNVLKPAMTELAEKSDLAFNYELVKEGRFYKKIVFIIKRQDIKETDNLKKKQAIIEKKSHQLEIPDDIGIYRPFYDKYEGDPDFHFSKKDLSLLLEKAAFNMELAESGIEAARSKESLNNFMGWIIKYIQAGGYEDVPTLNGSVDAARVMNEFKAEFEEEKKSGIVQERAWASFRSRDRFPEFLDFLADNGFDEQAFIDVYGYDRACKMFISWGRGMEVEF